MGCIDSGAQSLGTLFFCFLSVGTGKMGIGTDYWELGPGTRETGKGIFDFCTVLVVEINCLIGQFPFPFGMSYRPT
jgi:hypothetical protein